MKKEEEHAECFASARFEDFCSQQLLLLHEIFLR